MSEFAYAVVDAAKETVSKGIEKANNVALSSSSAVSPSPGMGDDEEDKNNWRRNRENSQQTHTAAEKKNVNRILRELKEELKTITKEQRGAIRDAIHESKNGSRNSMPIEKLRDVMRKAVGLE